MSVLAPRMVASCTAAAAAAAAAKSLQSCPTLCDPTVGSPTGSPVPGILQARTLEWVAISFSNAWKWKVKVKTLSRVRFFATPWTAVYQAPPSMGFSRQEYWSGFPLPSLHKVTILAQSDYCKKKYHILGDLEYKYLFLTVRRLESPGSRCWQIWCLERTCFLVHTQFSSHCLLTQWKGLESSLGSLLQAC